MVDDTINKAAILSKLLGSLDVKEEDKFLQVIQTNKEISNSLINLVTSIANTLEPKIINECSKHYTNVGMIYVVKAILNIYDTTDSTENLIDKLNNLILSLGVEKVITTDNKISIKNGQCAQRIVDVYNDPKDDSIITSLSPGYVIKTDEGEVVLRYEDIKINEAHYKTPFELFTQNTNNYGKSEN